MKIALIGVPGAGKTDLANVLQKVLKTDKSHPIVIDDYVQPVAERGDWGIGSSGGYLANLAISLERHGRERFWNEHPTITCGTVIESSVYMALNFEQAQKFKVEAERAEEGQRIQASMAIFACIFMDTFKYDKAYYLPPTNPIPEEDKRLKMMDQHLQAAFQAFKVDITPLMVEGESYAELVALRAERVKEDWVTDGSPTSG